ncbi:MAG: T9SS type A sorting domain-containing protein, partial [Bacteroidota bacterium]
RTIPNSTSPDGVIGFLEFKPKDYGTQKHPLIIFLHGIGERGNGTSQINGVAANAIPLFCSRGATMRFTVAGQTSSFVVLSPQLSKQYGYWPTYYVKEMIKYAKANLQIDPDRIYITGLSLGGGGTWRAITETNTENFDYSFDAGIAAAAPVCGTQEMNDGYFCKTVGDNHLPIWAFHCMDDGTVAVNATQHGEMIAKACGVTPAAKFTYYQSGGHGGAWINAFDTGHITTTVNGGGSFTANPNLYEWLLSNKRSTGQSTPTYTAPVANAGSGQTITLPLSIITLTGSGTGTNGATISSYSWTKTSGPSAGVISLPLLNISLVTGLVQGTYVFTLTVTDNHGLSSSSNVTITVNALLNKAPVADAGRDATITLPTNSVSLDGSASYDPEGSIVQYYWSQTSGPSTASIDDAWQESTTLRNLVEGEYVFSLQVKDNFLADSYSSVKITVNPAPAGRPANQAPVSNAGPDVTLTLPTNSVSLDASGSYDPDGSISLYYWTQTSGPSTAAIEDSWLKNTNLNNLVEGVYVFNLLVKDNAGTPAYSQKTITVNAAPAAARPPATEQPIGYIKTSVGPYQACDDGSSAGRIPIYSNGIANGNLMYLDAAHTKLFDGGWNWYSFTPSLGGKVTLAFAGYPNGAMALIMNCSSGAQVQASPASDNTLLGYIKISKGPYQACADASSDNRIAIYGTDIANGSYLYTDAALTQRYNGGWNWFSFTPVIGGSTTYAFAVYPTGGILLQRSCTNGGARMAASATTTAEQDEATLKNIRDSAMAMTTTTLRESKLTMYPNPVHTASTIELYSADNSVKTINLYNSNGILTAKYIWPVIKGNNTFSLKNVSGLANGLYIIDIRDNNGRPNGKLKFIKM